MPGRLLPTATCPKCSDGLLALADLIRPDGSIYREYFHEKNQKYARRRPCSRRFTPAQRPAADLERSMLEVPRKRGRIH